MTSSILEDNMGVVINGDAFSLIGDFADNSVDAVITDPPYFFDGMGDTWDEKMIKKSSTSKQRVTSLRAGMKFDKEQGKEFQKYMQKLAEESWSKIKPGGWFVSFSAPRLYHRLAVGVEDAGYEIRDMWEWLYTQNQMKAMSVARSMKNDEKLSEEEKEQLSHVFESWKTPQVKSCFEPIVLAQKPREGTFYQNWKKHGIGLVNVKSKMGSDDNMSTSNVVSTENIVREIDKAFLVGKPTKKEKDNSTHLSVKPLSLMGHIISVLVPKNGVVVDPFNGSGTTGVASFNKRVRFIGFEKDESYWNQSIQRYQAAGAETVKNSDLSSFSYKGVPVTHRALF